MSIHRADSVFPMKIRTATIHSGSIWLLASALSWIVVASIAATSQTKSKSKEQLEHLIYSVKGPDLFRAHCAACHGSDATGNGPLAVALKTKVPDLTVMTRNSGARFPSERVRRTILGDYVLMSHGSREMPVWGPIFHQVEADQDFGNVRVQYLVEYLESIQKK